MTEQEISPANPLLMAIETLIEKLKELQKAGATIVSIVDSKWNDYDIDSVEQNGSEEGDREEALIQISPIAI